VAWRAVFRGLYAVGLRTCASSAVVARNRWLAALDRVDAASVSGAGDRRDAPLTAVRGSRAGNAELTFPGLQPLVDHALAMQYEKKRDPHQKTQLKRLHDRHVVSTLLAYLKRAQGICRWLPTQVDGNEKGEAAS